MKINQKLLAIQSALHVGKDAYNSFGKYNYRNVESIYAALKPHLKEHDLVLYMTDAIEVHNDMSYVRATAKITDGEHEISNDAYAREAVTAAGMSDSQMTGTASSYARKYALGGLFLLDDNQDVDSMPAPKTYPEDKFNKNFPAWSQLIEKGTHTADNIAANCRNGGAPLTEKQFTALKEVKRVNEMD